jgi:tetratricopeptide (TPR) repeat protein
MALRGPLIGAIAALLLAPPGHAASIVLQQADTPQPARRAKLSVAQLFALADAARDRGDMETAEAAYRALAGDPAQQIRTEARFRLGMVLASLGRLSDAALLFRGILDEQPDAQRVRLELARLLDLLGDEAGARRALREAQAGGLPPAVARFVDRYSAALRAQKPFGASFELAIAPDSNINRATRSDTLGTVIGDFTLAEDAKQRSGVGAALKGQAYARARISERANLLARVSGAADVYRHGEHNDLALNIAVGPEIRLGRDRLTAEAGYALRWFGGKPYSTTANVAINYLRPLDRRSQLRATAGFGVTDNKRNPLQDGRSYALSLGYERALSDRTGVGAALAADRQDLRDPGYSTTGGQLTLFAYRDFGAATLIATIGYGRLETDERLFIYPRRRADDLYRASLGATFRQLTLGNFAPMIRLSWERNRSSIELFDYRRVRTEFGITRAF